MAKKNTPKQDVIMWKATAITSLAINAAMIVAIGVGLFVLLPMAAPNTAMDRFNNAASELTELCQPEEFSSIMEQIEKNETYDETGSKMVQVWNEFNCDLMKGGDGYSVLLNSRLEGQGLPPIEELPNHQK